MMRRALVYAGRAAVLVIAFPIVAGAHRHGGLASGFMAFALFALLALALIPQGED